MLQMYIKFCIFFKKFTTFFALRFRPPCRKKYSHAYNICMLSPLNVKKS